MKRLLLFVTTFLLWINGFSQSGTTIRNRTSDFPIVSSEATTIYTDAGDNWLVQKSAALLSQDIENITGKRPGISHNLPAASKNIIVIGTISQSAFIKQLAKTGKIKIDSLAGKWEAYQVRVVTDPFKGIGSALVIAGSDKRGTAYGVFELSRLMGVSPWCWWADVPAKKKTEIFIPKNYFAYDRPLVKYRGIFINDEAPAFSGWTKEKFGGVNHFVYEKIFELLLRLKANYLWPAMWGNAFNDDDTLNPVLADKWGIVMGTSHHEPMLRAQQEWKRYGTGAWNYETNKPVLDSFWQKGIENMDSHESIVTIGMRGDGDKPMTQGTAIQLLEKIVADQRNLIENVTHKPASATPQDWALYKEVQDYYDKGMRVPDDVTLLLCDDNWGNIRKLPKLSDKPRRGGYGIYYHFDYVGGPRNYKWINTNNIARVWEQMHLAYKYGVDKIWIVNVGDLKPMEFPISFFLDYAWNPNKWNEDNLQDYYTQWSKEQFGPDHAMEIGNILAKYSQYVARRKPELLSPQTYSLVNYNEADKIIREYDRLVNEAEKINSELPAQYKDAFFELVLFPVKAFVNLNNLYVAVAKNRKLAAENFIEANQCAEKAKQYYVNDSLLSNKYNHAIANGKWDHMMDQTHIGYTYWQQPPVNKMPEVKWIQDSSTTKVLTDQADLSETTIDMTMIPQKISGNWFREIKGCVSIEASKYTKAINTKNIHWKIIPGIGRDGDGITTFPVTVGVKGTTNGNPYLQYDIFVYDTGNVKIDAYFSPTLNFHNDSLGLQYAISIDNEKPQLVSVNKDDKNGRLWNKWVADNIIIATTKHRFIKSGKHVVKYWMVSPALVLQKVVLDFGDVKESYLGPPETVKN